MASTGSGSSVPRIQVFRPTMEEFRNFSKYIEKIEESGAHKAGLAKIIPPESWNPRKGGYDDIDLIIPAPISQYVTGRQGLYQQYNIQQKAMTVKEFKKLAEGPKFKTPSHFDYEDLERKYWKNITYNSPIYGADVSGSLYDKNIEEFNIQHLNTILDLVKDDYEIQIEGVNTAYLYFGMWKTTFAWHTEDMDLYSINYLHFGAPKSWYAIPPEHGRRLERLAANFFHGSSSACPAFLRHKMTIISPQILKQYCIPFNKITQEPGEFMITFPFGYHSGFNHGFNCAESTNFALPRWVEYGKRAISCTCRNDCVKICMDMFVRKFQPDRYELWKQGKDIGTHPEDPTRHYAAPAPKKLELAIAAQREERKKAKMLQMSSKIKRNPVSKLDKNNKKYKILSETDEIIRNHEDSDSKGTEIYDMNVEDDDIETKEFNSKISQDDSELYLSDMEAVQHVEISTTISENEDTEEDDTKNENIVDEAKACIAIVAKDEAKTCVAIAAKNEVKACTDIRAKDEAKACVAKDTDCVMSDDQIIGNGNKIAEETVLSDCHMNEIFHPDIPSTNRSNIEPSQNFEKQNKPSPIDEALLLRFPALRQAIDSGTLALTCITPTPFEKSSPSCTASNSFTLQNIHQQQPKVQTEEPFILGNVPDTNLSNIHLKPRMDVKKPSFSTGNWKCEQTQGLKVRLAKQVQPIGPCDSTPTFTSFKFDSSFSKEQNHQNPKEPNVSQSEFIKSSFPTSYTIHPSSEELSAANQRTTDMDKTLVPVSLSHPPGNDSDSKNELDFEKCESKSKKDHRKRDSCSKNVKAADDTIGNWAQPILKLWQHYPFEFEEEKKFNIHCSTIEPHCSICVVFSPCNIDKDYPNPPIKVPATSKVKMPPFCFGNNLENQPIVDSNPLLSRDGTAPLLVCSVCQVCVHATCYGVTMLQMGDWMCSKCSSGELNVECCLCVMRGGALKRTSNGGWAHILCAVLIPETYFENVSFKEPINVSRLTPTRLKLKCRYCLKSGQNQSLKGKACVQCLSGKCYLPFHVTCGYVAGVIYDATDWPEPLNISCTRHSASRRKPSKRIFTSVNVGDRVIAKHKKNKRYYWVQVKRVYSQKYYSILFEDNSTSTNTLPEDIVEREVSNSNAPLNINEKVKVKWPDGITYNAVFKGSRSCTLYVIEFDDGMSLTQERHQIYASDENIPKEILSKIGTSTESRLNDCQKYGSDGKRIRISNSKYV